jgi:hypothetical protein
VYIKVICFYSFLIVHNLNAMIEYGRAERLHGMCGLSPREQIPNRFWKSFVVGKIG